METEKVIGIDIGTTRCCSSCIKNGYPTAIPTSTGKSLTPSYVYFQSENDVIVGEIAINRMIKGENDTVYATKRLIGRLFEDREVQDDINRLTYVVDRGIDGKPIIVVDVNGREIHYTPVDICNFILKQIKKDAENYLHHEVNKAVICVPAYFKDEQRKDTKFAAERAGFEVLRIVNEPTAAAIAYSFNRITSNNNNNNGNKNNKTLLVYDLGGGTFDVSVIKVEGSEINVIATGGDSHLGGEDFTNSIVSDIIAQHEKNTGIILRRKREMMKLKNSCEEAKIILSANNDVEISVDKEYSYTMTRERFTELNHGLFQRTIEIVNRTLAEIKMSPEEIDDIILIGGGSRMPQIPSYIEEKFKTARICMDINPDEAVSQGAAIVANEVLYNNKKVVRNDLGEYMMMNHDIDLDESEFSVVIDYKNHKGNVNECVVKDKEGRISLKEKPEVGDETIIPSLKYRPIINDILSHSIGYEIHDDKDPEPKMFKIINKNTRIPVEVSQKFKTVYDNQTVIPVKIYEGEDKYTKNNSKLDEFEVPDIPKLPKGDFQVRVVTSIDANGILDVKVYDLKNNLRAFHRTDVSNRSLYK